MSLWKHIVERRRRKAHERYLQEHARQRTLEGQDAQDAVRRAAQRSGEGQQAAYWQGP